MRASIQAVQAPTGFVPVELKIVIENKDDLASLWARFNMSGEVLAPAAQAAAIKGKKGAFSRGFYETISKDPEGKKDVWKLLNAELKKAGIARR